MSNLRSELQSLHDATGKLLSVLGGAVTSTVTPSTVSSPAPSRSTPASGSVSVDQGQLLQLVNMMRRFTRYSREGNIPSKEQRKYARRAIKAVKHLLPTSTAQATR